MLFPCLLSSIVMLVLDAWVYRFYSGTQILGDKHEFMLPKFFGRECVYPFSLERKVKRLPTDSSATWMQYHLKQSWWLKHFLMRFLPSKILRSSLKQNLHLVGGLKHVATTACIIILFIFSGNDWLPWQRNDRDLIWAQTLKMRYIGLSLPPASAALHRRACSCCNVAVDILQTTLRLSVSRKWVGF